MILLQSFLDLFWPSRPNPFFSFSAPLTNINGSDSSGTNQLFEQIKNDQNVHTHPSNSPPFSNLSSQFSVDFSDRYLKIVQEYASSKIFHETPFTPQQLVFAQDPSCASTCGILVKYVQENHLAHVVGLGGIVKGKQNSYLFDSSSTLTGPVQKYTNFFRKGTEISYPAAVMHSTVDTKDEKEIMEFKYLPPRNFLDLFPVYSASLTEDDLVLIARLLNPQQLLYIQRKRVAFLILKLSLLFSLIVRHANFALSSHPKKWRSLPTFHFMSSFL